MMRIEGYVFYGCTNLSVVYYCGSEYEGSQIPLSFNDYLKDVKILYNYVMIPTLPTTQTKITKKSGYSIVNISVKDADEGSIILMSTYKNGALSDIQSEEYDGEDIMMATFEPYDTVKVMIWESLESMKPLSIPETVN